MTRSHSKSNAYRTLPKLVALGFLEPWTPGTKTPAKQDIQDAPGARNGRAESATDQIQTEKRERTSVQTSTVDAATPTEDLTIPGLAELGDERYFAISQLMVAIGSHADNKTKQVVVFFGAKLPPATLHEIREAIINSGPTIKNRAGYAVQALKTEGDRYNVVSLTPKGAA